MAQVTIETTQKFLPVLRVGAAALMFMLTGSRWLSLDQILYSKYPDGIKIGKIRIPLW